MNEEQFTARRASILGRANSLIAETADLSQRIEALRGSPDIGALQDLEARSKAACKQQAEMIQTLRAMVDDDEEVEEVEVEPEAKFLTDLELMELFKTQPMPYMIDVMKRYSNKDGTVSIEKWANAVRGGKYPAPV